MNSCLEIEKQIVNYRLHFSRVKDADIEWRFQPPPFVSSFLVLIEKEQKVPTQAEFCDHYVRSNQGVLASEFAERWSSESTRIDKGLALIARLERAYPSFVRDLYFLALLRENGIFAEYRPVVDVENGVDLVVHARDITLFIHVFLATERAKRGRALKDRRHVYAGNHVDIVIRPEECKKVGAFWLPSLVHVAQVKERLREISGAM